MMSSTVPVEAHLLASLISLQLGVCSNTLKRNALVC